MKQVRSDVTFQQGSIKSQQHFTSQWLISTALWRLFQLLSLSSERFLSKLTICIFFLKFCIIKLLLFYSTVAGVVPSGGRKKSPRTSS